MKREVAEESDKPETDCKVDGWGAEPRPNRVLVAICGHCSNHDKRSWWQGNIRPGDSETVGWSGPRLRGARPCRPVLRPDFERTSVAQRLRCFKVGRFQLSKSPNDPCLLGPVALRFAVSGTRAASTAVRSLQSG